MDHVPLRRRRARPVADPSVSGLAAGSRELAKGWLLALVELAPLESAGEILGGRLATDGPRLCEGIVLALGDDAALAQLRPGGELEMLAAAAAELGGRGDVESALQAVAALQAVMWSAIRAELRAPDPDLVSELHERLALVLDAVREAALRHVAPAEWDRSGADIDDVAVTSLPEPSAAPVSESPRVGEPSRATPPFVAAPPPVAETAPVASPTSNGDSEAEATVPHTAAPGPMTVLWQEALEEEVARAVSTGADLSLLLIEFDDAERLRAAESAGRVYGTFAGFLQAVRSVVRRQDILARESEERIWVIARGTARDGAQALAERALSAVKRTAPWRGTPPAASAGVAVLGEDAEDRDGLIAVCEEDRFGATAAGLGVSWARG